jgi:predicted transposase YdaD
MSSSSPRVHDRFFKQIFNRPENVRDFIITYLPAEIVAHLELESLEVVSGNYVDVPAKNMFLQAVQLLLKYIQSPELRDQLPRIVELLGRLAEKELATEYLQVVLEYVFQASEHVDASDVREAFEKLPQGTVFLIREMMLFKI